jgi:predicted acyl esterase
MKNIYFSKKRVALILLLFTTQFVISQSNNNGKLDTITEFSTIISVPFTMPDGVILETDIYLPIISDSVTADIGAYTIELIPKGTQIFVYDSIGNSLNPNKYQLPIVFTRTPYGKNSFDEYGVVLNILGFAYALQDMRGRHHSGGVYLPMYSDAWDKYAYHPNETHPLDITGPTDPLNGNFHQDGRYSIDFIKDSLYRYYDLDGNGTLETYDKTYDGSIVMFGASALGNTQYQAASSYKINVNQNGLKGLIPVVATNEHFNSVTQHNGVFRQALVQGWLTGQIEDNIDTIPSDNDIQNNVHSIFDYGNISGDTIIKRAIDFVTTIPDANGYSGMYPNNTKRVNVDAKYAPINNLGDSDPNGIYNRYSNLELPIYHLTGWWDIFIDGQIDTYNNVMENTSLSTRKNQKLVIGPWTHGTIGQDTVGDIIFPPSVFDLRVAAHSIGSNTNYSELVDGEVVSWLRYLLNYNPNHYIGEPKVLIPESNKWQDIGSGNYIRVPSEDYYIRYPNFINYLGGFSGLDSLPIELDNGGTISSLKVTIPADTSLQQPNTQAVNDPASAPIDFEQIPNIRFFVPGPVNDGEALNSDVGNYWTSSESFPLSVGVRDYTLYFHHNGSLDTLVPNTVEPVLSYNHNPNNPVQTVGGGNLGIETPQGDRYSAGPMNYADTAFAPYTMDRLDVLRFETSIIQDSLCIIGIPIAKIYASSNPQSGPIGPTDTDFFVRILDVYPDGREYFVVEGAVNARARDYSKQLATGQEDINIPYTNITAGHIYEFEFRMLPIAYTFGHNHKIKILISSSNYPRYQSNANVPIEQGDFFRRNPNDGLNYSYNSISYPPRIARQDIYFTPTQSSQITLPLFDGVGVSIKEENKEEDANWFVYPNPANNEINIVTNFADSYTIRIFNLTGQLVMDSQGSGNQKINIGALSTGIYIVKITTKNGLIKSQKLIKE